MKFFCLITSFTLTAFSLFGQDTSKTDLDKREGYKQWTKYRNSFRLGFGIQKSFYTEIGFSKHRYIYNDLGFGSTAYYTAIEFTPEFSSNKRSIYALKFGFEMNGRALALGIETKYQTDFNANDIAITPKVGLGFFGVFNLFYGYNIFLSSNPFLNIAHNQFSIISNLNRQFFRNKKT